MRINFRQGIISKQSGFLQLNGSGNIDLVASNRPVTLTIAHKDTDYQFNEPVTITDAWKGVFDANTTYWLYWDFNLLTLERTFGSTTLQPLTQSSEPTSGTDSDGQAILQPGRMWFDTVNFVNYVYQGTSFKPVLRVFAGNVTGGNTISTASINTDFTGTQIGVTTSTFAGRPIFDNSGNPVQKSDGTFFTTESSFFSSGTRVDTIRLESNSVRAQSTESNIAKFTAVAWNGSGQIKSAVYNDTGNTVVGILLEDTALDQVGSVLVQGTVTNPDWNWTNIGQKLWIDNNGTLTDTDPHTSNVSANPQKKVPVARVLSSDTIIFEQGLGGVGPTGATGSISNLPAATTSDLGAVRLTAQPSNTQSPLAVSDNDSRLTDARPPTSHSHSAGDITLTPTGNVSSNDIQNAIGELDSEKVAKTGDSMSGFLTLSADPTNNLHATTKRYVDGLVSGLVWREPISVLNMIADDMTSPPSSPVEGDTYLMPSGTTGAWSGYDPDDVISWDGSSWVNRGQITNLASEPRIGIAFDTPTTPSGSFNGRKNQIAVYDQMSDIQTFITPVKNDAVFVRSASDQFAFFQYAYDGTSWVQFGGLQAIDMLNDIGDVDAPSPSDGQALIFDSSSGNWIPGAGGAETLDQLNDVSASAPSDDQVLQFNSSSGNWENVTADFGASTLDQLDDVSALSPNDNDILFFSQGGTQQNWIYDSGYDGVYAIASDSSGNVYITDDSSQSIRKVDSSGTEQWSLINLFTTTRGITVDNDGNVHASLASGGVTKYDPSNGSQISSFDPGNISLDLAVDSNNNIIVLIFNQVENYTQSGILNWSSPTFSNNTDRVAVDSDDNVYASANNEVRKLDATGSQIWVDDNIHTNAINDMDTDTSGNLYTASSDGIRKIDPDGNLIWSFSTPGVPAQGIGVDSNNLVYAGFDDQIVYILDSDGNSVTSYTQPTSEIRDIDVNSSDQVFIGLGVDHSVHSIDYQSPAWNIQQLILDNVDDVNAPAPSDGQALIYDSSSGNWIPGSAGGTLQENDYWMVQAALLDPAAYVYLKGPNWSVTVPAGETWYVLNSWQTKFNNSLASWFHRDLKNDEAFAITEGTTVSSNGNTNGNFYFCRPSLVTYKAEFNDAKALYFERVATINAIANNEISINIPAGSAAGTVVVADFPTDFKDAMAIQVNSFDVAWTVLGGGDSDREYLFTTNTLNEISDDHILRSSGRLYTPFERHKAKNVRARAGNISGNGTDSSEEGDSIFLYAKLPDTFRSDIVTPYESEIQTDSPALWYKLDDRDGPTALDSGSTGLNGSFTGTYTTGAVAATTDCRSSVRFTNGRVEIPDNPVLDFGDGDFTIEAWILFRTLPDSSLSDPWIVQTWQIDTGNDYSFLLTVENQRFVFQVRLTDDTDVKPASTIALTTNKYYHVICGRSGNNIFIRVVGEESRQVATAGTLELNPVSNGVWIAQGWISGSSITEYEVDGLIDEVAIYTSDIGDIRADAHHDAALG